MVKYHNQGNLKTNQEHPIQTRYFLFYKQNYEIT